MPLHKDLVSDELHNAFYAVYETEGERTSVVSYPAEAIGKPVLVKNAGSGNHKIYIIDATTPSWIEGFADVSTVQNALAQATADKRESCVPLTSIEGTGFFRQYIGDPFPGSYRSTQAKLAEFSASIDRIPVGIDIDLTDVAGGGQSFVSGYIKTPGIDATQIGTVTSAGDGSRQTISFIPVRGVPPTLSDLIPGELIIRYLSGGINSTQYYIHHIEVRY